jgi:hypothetical protein
VAGVRALAKEHRRLLQRTPHAPGDRDPHRGPAKRNEPCIAARSHLKGNRVRERLLQRGLRGEGRFALTSLTSIPSNRLYLAIRSQQHSELLNPKPRQLLDRSSDRFTALTR